MRATISIPSIALLLLVAAGCGEPAGTLNAARAALHADTTRSIAFSGTGKWYQFGQAPNPSCPGRSSTCSYTTTVNYAAPSARVQMVRMQTVEPGRARPVPVEQRVDHYVNGTSAWNGHAAGRGRRCSSRPQPQPAAVEERVMEIWTTPHGFLKAAAANNATAAPRRRIRRVSSRSAAGIATSARSTRRTRSSTCRHGSTTPSSVTRRSSSPTVTTATSAA